MQKLQVNGGKKLSGSIDIHGAKNSALPILAASVLINGTTTIHNCPNLSDVDISIDILRSLGALVIRGKNTLFINSTSINNFNINENLMHCMRSSIIFLGSLLSKLGSANMCVPGGCDIGLRPIDMHIDSLKKLGYAVDFDGNSILCSADNLKACNIVLPFASVGATENIILASVFIDGTTTIINAAREPEVVDLVNYLNSAGAKIYGAGTSNIKITGVKSLHSNEYSIIPDRILASTIMSCAAITGGDVVINKIIPSHLSPVISLFDDMACKMYVNKSSLRIIAPKRLKRIKFIATQPYPGFPTDCQAILMAALTTANGTSAINETVFENRFKHIAALNKFGADIVQKDRIAIINGVKSLHSADVKCTDLRGGAAMVVASLASNGTSNIYDIEHIDRGYQNIETQLKNLGADIKRIVYEKE